MIADTVVQGNLVVPDGQTWLIGRNVQIAGNLRTVGGTIAMRPGSSLKLLGANPDAYVGGGLTYSDQLVNDIGVWVGPQGALEAPRRRELLGRSDQLVQVALVTIGRGAVAGHDRVEVGAHRRKANGQVNDARCRIGPGTTRCRGRPAT